MKICICDDEELYRKKEMQICRSVFGNESEIISVSGGEEVVRYQKPFDLLLLDIDMPELDGISVKNALQDMGSETMILFITNHEERMREAFGMHVFGFVDKKRMDTELPRMLERAAEAFCPSCSVAGEDGTVYDSRRILYIEAEGKNYVRLFLKGGQSALIRGTLKELWQRLEMVDFYQIHKSFLVNMREITELKEKSLLIGEAELPVSARKKSEVKRAYKELLRRRMRYL